MLLDRMVYGEDDLLRLEVEDAAVPAGDTDINIRHYGAKSYGPEREDNPDTKHHKTVLGYTERRR